jgi:uncharacterized Zn finger protein
MKIRSSRPVADCPSCGPVTCATIAETDETDQQIRCGECGTALSSSMIMTSRGLGDVARGSLNTPQAKFNADENGLI